MAFVALNLKFSFKIVKARCFWKKERKLMTCCPITSTCHYILGGEGNIDLSIYQVYVLDSTPKNKIKKEFHVIYFAWIQETHWSEIQAINEW